MSERLRTRGLSDDERNYLREHVTGVWVEEWPDRGHHVLLAEPGEFAARLRSGLRADQAQPRDDPLPTKRQGAARSEWRLIAAIHNLLNLHNHLIAAATA